MIFRIKKRFSFLFRAPESDSIQKDVEDPNVVYF